MYIGTTNGSEQRSVSAFALRPSNDERGYYFMSLDSGCRLHGYIWKELLIPNHVIYRVKELANYENAPDLDEDGCPIFEWEFGEPVVEDEAVKHHVDDKYENLTDDEDKSVASDTEDIEDADDIENNDAEANSSNNKSDNEDESENGSSDEDSNDKTKDETDDELANEDDDEHKTGMINDDNDDNIVNADVTGAYLHANIDDDVDAEQREIRSAEEDATQEERSATSRPQRNHTQMSTYEPTFGEKSYDMSMLNVASERPYTTTRDMYSAAVNAILNQMTAVKGLKLFGERAFTKPINVTSFF